MRYTKGSLEDLDRKLSQLEERINQMESKVASLDSTVKKIQEKETSKPQDFYNAALQLFMGGQYLDAMEMFKKFIKEFPEHPLAGNAQYWTGKSLLALKKPQQAILAFDKVVKGYPDSPKVPSALLKEAITFLSLGNKKVATILFKRLINEYPGTDQAKMAAQKLKSMTPKSRSRGRPASKPHN